jgi:hypothetical protein
LLSKNDGLEIRLWQRRGNRLQAALNYKIPPQYEGSERQTAQSQIRKQQQDSETDSGGNQPRTKNSKNIHQTAPAFLEKYHLREESFDSSRPSTSFPEPARDADGPETEGDENERQSEADFLNYLFASTYLFNLT